MPLDSLADIFERRVEELAEEITRRSLAEIADWSGLDSPEIWDRIKAITCKSRLAEAEHLRVGLELPKSCPPPDRDAADLAVRAGVSLPAALKSYRIACGVTWRTWLEAAEQLDLSRTAYTTLLRALSEFTTAYEERLMDLFSDAFAECSSRRRGRGARELELVRELLSDRRHDLAGLSYDVVGAHLALVVWGPSPELAIQRLSRELGTNPLAVRVEEDLWWAWLGNPPADTSRASAQIRKRDLPVGVRVAIGTTDSGVGGFRRSHRHAGAAHRVAALTDRRITSYPDVALEAMALQDGQAAREFVRVHLGALDASNGRSGELKATLRQYFASSQNAASTAAAMGIHGQTVARRLHAIEGLLGHPVNRRRAELELALRLESMLDLGG